MAEVIHVFENQVFLDGRPYIAQVVGREVGHIWEGWIEFGSEDGVDVRRTRRETTQPNRAALEYWASGVSGTYLEGALARTLDPTVPVRRELPPPYYEEPAPNPVGDVVVADRAILDPFAVAEKGERMLRQELGALADWHLRNIVRAYRLAPATVDIESLTQRELEELIVSRVQPA